MNEQSSKMDCPPGEQHFPLHISPETKPTLHGKPEDKAQGRKQGGTREKNENSRNLFTASNVNLQQSEISLKQRINSYLLISFTYFLHIYNNSGQSNKTIKRRCTQQPKNTDL